MAVLLDFEVTQATVAKTIVQLGNRDVSPGGGGLFVRLTSTGRLQLNADGATVTGTIGYADAAVHRMMAAWDPSASGGNGRWFIATDAEIVVLTPPGANVGNSSTKGFGSAFDGYLGGAPAWFYRQPAREVMTPSSRATLGVQEMKVS